MKYGSITYFHTVSGQIIIPPTPTNDSAPLLSGQLTPGTTPVQNVNGFGNTLYQQYQHTPSPVEGEEPRNVQYQHTPPPVEGEEPSNVPHATNVNGYGGNTQVNGVIDGIGNGYRNGFPGQSGSEVVNGHAISSGNRNNNIKNVRNDIDLEIENLHGGAIGGIDKDNEEFNCSKDKKKMKLQCGAVCIHDNIIENFHIHMNDKGKSEGQKENRSKEDVKAANDSSVSESSSRTGLSASPTFALRHVEQDRNDANTGSSEGEAVGDTAGVGDIVAMENLVNDKGPACRPELSFVPTSGSQGCDVREGDNKQDEKRMEEKPPNIGRPLQPPIAGGGKPFIPNFLML